MSEFDQKAQEWDKNQMHLERTIAVARRLKEMVNITPGMKAMEFGAGTGLLSFYLKDLFSEITLIDSSPEMLRMAGQKMESGDQLKFRTLCLDLETEEYTGDPFDIIYSQMVLHHEGFHDTAVSPCFIIRKEISADNIKEFPVFLMTARK